MILNWANRITIMRILLLVPFVSFMLKINDPAISDTARDWMRYISVILFFIMAASDVLDGYLARRKKQITRLGSFLDPTADKLLMACACVLLAYPGGGVDGFGLPPTVAVLIIGKDLFLLLGFLIVYFITFQVRIVPVFVGKIATTLQLSMVAGILLAPDISKVIPWWIWVLRVLWWGAAGTAIWATLIYIWHGSRYIEDYEHELEKKNQN